MSKTYTVFYAGLLLGTFTPEELRTFRVSCGEEIYNGAFVHSSRPLGWGSVWLRIDMTPVSEEDVPNELRTILLLLHG